ncbi:MAG: PilZ domain-containing protein [Deltaproteobacteria bacterium]|nr:PilZ domain-containing protein [Deltaproteobacteria bacterium]
MKKRFELRRRKEIPIEIISSHWDEPLTFTSGDLSPRGTYIFSEMIPDMGEYLVCSFRLGNNKNYNFFGKVVRTNLNRRKIERRNPGFGIEFLDSKPIERIQIRESLRGTPPPNPVFPKMSGKREISKRVK